MAPSGSNISIKYIVLAAAIIGTFQAVAWFGLSLISILFYESAIENDNTSNDDYGNCIYNLYLNPNYDAKGIFIIYPKTFNYFMFIYLVLSFIWLIASCFIIWAVFRGKWNNMTNLSVFWSIVTITIAILDITLMSLVAVDLQKAHDSFNTPTTVPSTITTSSSITPTTVPNTISTSSSVTPTTVPSTITTSSSITPTESTTAITIPTVQSASSRIVGRFLRIPEITSNTDSSQMIYTSMGIVMSLAARGYVLWVVNVTFAIMLILLVQKMKKTNRPTLLPAIDAYATRPRPFTLYEQTDIGQGYNNNGFNLDENVIFSPRQISDPRTESNIPRYPLTNSSGSSVNNSQPPTLEPARPAELLGPVDTNRQFKNKPPPLTKLAKIGKSSGGRLSPPRNVSSPVLPNNMPYIPDPDYTPPASPYIFQPKSVLRSRSKYD